MACHFDESGEFPMPFMAAAPSMGFADACGFLTPTGFCGVEGELPTCRDCDRLVCVAHAVPGSLKEQHFDLEGDGDHGPEATMRETVVCLSCNTPEAA